MLRGEGRFTDDFSAPGQAFAAFVRSDHPHARIRAIDTSAALAVPGVIAAYTGEDAIRAGLVPIDHRPIPSTRYDLKLAGPRGESIFVGAHQVLPTDKVRHVGEAIAMIIAESEAAASLGVDAVAVDYDLLPAVAPVSSMPGLGRGATAVWDEVPDNICVDTLFGDQAATDHAFSRADIVVEEEFHIDRVTGVPLEPRSALAIWEADRERVSLYAGSGGAVRQRQEIAGALGLGADQLRVVSPDVGGNFGTRNRVYVEFALVVWAAFSLRRSVKFTATRADAFVSDYQGRDLVTRVALALSKHGDFLALRADNVSNVGARVVSLSPLAKGTALVTGSYAIPAVTARARAVFSNTVPTQAYRSSGRPEVTFAIERLVELAAQKLDLDPIALRQRNLVPAPAMPYPNALGMVYDSGDYGACLERALSGVGAREAHRCREVSEGRLRGIGIAHYVESSTGAPVERAEITVLEAGRVRIATGTQPSGQGHETSFAQVAAEWLGIAPGVIDIVLGDTDVVAVGGGSHSGRSMRMAGTVITMACETLLRRARELAAAHLEVGLNDLEYNEGAYRVAGTDRSVTLFALGRYGLTAAESNEMHRQVFPNGCHACEVEVDPETGNVEVIRYVAVDDVGRAINPMIVEGQTHGGVAQGVGQALRERCVIDGAGQPLTGSLMDYGLLRAADLPFIDAVVCEVPSPTNPLGVKAGGEGGTTPALVVVLNAVLDAVGAEHAELLSLPLTPEKVWRACRAAGLV